MGCIGLPTLHRNDNRRIVTSVWHNTHPVHLVPEGQLTDRFVEITVQFFVSDAANVDIAVIHGDICQIVQVAEHTHLAKSCV